MCVQLLGSVLLLSLAPLSFLAFCFFSFFFFFFFLSFFASFSLISFLLSSNAIEFNLPQQLCYVMDDERNINSFSFFFFFQFFLVLALPRLFDSLVQKLKLRGNLSVISRFKECWINYKCSTRAAAQTIYEPSNLLSNRSEQCNNFKIKQRNEEKTIRFNDNKSVRLKYFFWQVKDILWNILADQKVADFVCEGIAIMFEEVVRARAEIQQQIMKKL